MKEVVPATAAAGAAELRGGGTSALSSHLSCPLPAVVVSRQEKASHELSETKIQGELRRHSGGLACREVPDDFLLVELFG
jgi:hypothetical protein